MRLLKAILVSAAVLLAATASGLAPARGSHGGGGHFGGGSHFGGGHGSGGGHFSGGRGSAGTHFSGAHRGGFHSGSRIRLFVGAPLLRPWYYYPPLAYGYDYAPAYAVSTSPQAYVEQSPGPAEQPSYWYYCSSSKSYYPYVTECPEGWQQVAPQAVPPS